MRSSATRPQIDLAEGAESKTRLLGILTALTLIGLWSFVSAMGWIAPKKFPPPWLVWEAFLDLKPNILVHAGSTAILVLCGLAWGTFLGFSIGLLLRQSFIFRSTATAVIESMRPVPAVAITPFFLIWFGFDWFGKLLLVTIGVFLVIVIGVITAIDRIHPMYVRSAASFGATNWKFLCRAAYPAILPNMAGPLRIALALAITLAVVSEYMGATLGIGNVLNVAYSNYASHTILLCIIVLGLLGAILDKLLQALHSTATSWHASAEDALHTRQ
jgi:ABC-type nitrate/sulfonate/bicarbonate transport system permease component